MSHALNMMTANIFDEIIGRGNMEPDLRKGESYNGSKVALYLLD